VTPCSKFEMMMGNFFLLMLNESREIMSFIFKMLHSFELPIGYPEGGACLLS